jgi:hypothetical protein
VDLYENFSLSLSECVYVRVVDINFQKFEFWAFLGQTVREGECVCVNCVYLVYQYYYNPYCMHDFVVYDSIEFRGRSSFLSLSLMLCCCFLYYYYYRTMNTEREPRKYRYILYTILLEWLCDRTCASVSPKKFKNLIFETAPEQSGHLHISQLSIIGSRERERKSVCVLR